MAKTYENFPGGSRLVVVMVCGLLALAVALVFCQTGGYDFVNFDDDHYVYDNEHIHHGFTWHGLFYYAIHWHAYTYHPLSTYSHMLDCQLFGLDAGGHHGMNVVLHAITAVLLFLLVRQMTGRLWPSALVAALFAIHPLRVESVAWVAERKDVLSGLFFVLTLGAYVRYVRACSVGILPASKGRYAIVCLLYLLGLLAKPMLVTLPLVLLLLDYWPLRRWQAVEDGDEAETDRETEIGDPAELCGDEVVDGNPGKMPTLLTDAGKMPTLPKARHIPWHLLIEKIPLLLLSVAASALTVHTQVNAIQSLESISWLSRIANALVAYVSYLGCFFWPSGLAVLYPHLSEGISSGTAGMAAAILVAISASVFLGRRQAPYLLVGWLWYMGMLVPVIGLLQVGGQKMADRYTYLPQIGLVLGLVWALTDLTDFLATRAEAAVRRLSGCKQDAYIIKRFLLALSVAGMIAALAVAAWRQTGYWRDSETLWGRDMMYPNLVAHYNLGLTLAFANRHEEAIQQFEKAYAIGPNDEDTLYSYAQSLGALGRTEDAITKYREVLAVNEKSTSANDGLAWMLLRQGKDREALACWRYAMEAEPKNIVIRGQIAGLLAASPDASVRNGKEAVLVALKLVELTGGKDPLAFDTLAAAHAEIGNFAAAAQNAQTALDMATASGAEKLVEELQERLKLYQLGKPYRRVPKKSI